MERKNKKSIKTDPCGNYTGKYIEETPFGDAVSPTVPEQDADDL